MFYYYERTTSHPHIISHSVSVYIKKSLSKRRNTLYHTTNYITAGSSRVSVINKMEYILEETVPSEDLKKFEQKYHEELQHGKVLNA